MEPKTQNLIQKPPVVVVLGHIDHGKTSLLQFIREKRIEERKIEITQHIGAYQIEKDNKKITFIDTPGHEAFSQMRSRGAKVADIALLVVAADEGVKEQTKEAISHIKTAGIPLIVVINKIDKPGSDPERIKRELQKESILVESLGGKIPSVETSAKTGQGIDELLDLILLVAEMENLKADLSSPAQGVVIEAFLDSKRGASATLILEEGTLKVGDFLATPSTLAKVKSLEDFSGKKIKEATAGQPVLVLGFEKIPQVGEHFKVFSNIEEGKSYLKNLEKKPISEISEVSPEQKVLNLILKADVLGSLEAINEILKSLPQEKVVIRILKSDIGEINENDVKLAKSSNAKILGFRVKTNTVAQNLALREKVTIIHFRIIYELVETVRKLMEKMIEPQVLRKDLGKVKVLVNFWQEKNRQIVGGRVIEGEIKKGTFIEILRGEEIIGKGKMVNLQKNKKDIEIGKKGEEVGILYEGEGKIEVGDILIIYNEEKKKTEI